MSVGEQFETWLAGNLPEGWMAALRQGDENQWRALRQDLDEADFLERLGRSGWAQPSWPRAYGGLDLGPEDVAVVEAAKSDWRVPVSFNLLGFGLAAPTLMQWGTEEQKVYFLNRMAQGEFWCQLFSEPGNGSDVAGLATRAVRDGDEWVVNGQKVWTSGAHLARRGMLLARSDPDQPKHKGITYFICDMDAPGVEVRPLRQLTGDAEFNEVFLTDVRIPDAHRIGPAGQGWAVAQTTLMNERVALSGAFGPGGGARRGARPGPAAAGRFGPADLLRTASDLPAPLAAPARDRSARLLIQARVAGYNAARGAARRRSGQQPGPEGSVGKLFGTEFNQKLQEAGVDVLGPAAAAWDPADEETRARVRSFLRSRGNTIEGGTSEIQRNILGDRVLGLPREPDPSRDSPWKDVPRNQGG